MQDHNCLTVHKGGGSNRNYTNNVGIDLSSLPHNSVSYFSNVATNLSTNHRGRHACLHMGVNAHTQK